jgi:hypothetical protein
MAPRKCEPGTICLENWTLGLFLILFIILAFLYYIFLTRPTGHPYIYSMPLTMAPPISSIGPIGSIGSNVTPNVMMDPYTPPVRTDGMYFPTRPRGIPVNIETRGLQNEYTQMGIITCEHKENMILPLMGRRLITGLDKWQYYTISNTGAINTKLPIRYKGRGCSGEYGCDCLMNGDVVYVEGYQDTFRVTLYDTATFQYIPYI